jgi:GT2 family glycosyltransferase
LTVSDTPLPTASVVVVTYGREEELVNTVGDLLAQTYPELEVLVVDQTPSHEPKVRERLADWQASGAIQWYQLSPPSLTRARNVGWQRASGQLVIFVDDDVRLPPDYVSAMVEAFRCHPEVAAVAGRILEPGRPPEVVRWRVGDLGWCGARLPGFGTPRSGPAYSLRGCNMAFRRMALEAVGGFDEGYRKSAFREDADIAFRLRQAGQRLWFSAEAWLYHLSAQQGGTRHQEIDVDRDVIFNDLRFAVLRLRPLRREAWLTRLYLSRVLKAGLRTRRLKALHQAFWEAWRTVWAELGGRAPADSGPRRGP